MRRLTHALLALAGVIMGTGVATAAPVLHLSGWKASAGKPETFTITRVGGNGGLTVTFSTGAPGDTAQPGPDYTATTQTIIWSPKQASMTVVVPTFINMAKAGTNITFTASIGSSSATGLIMEPPAPIVSPPPPPLPTPTPTPAPTQAEPVPAAGFQEIADNFTTADGIGQNIGWGPTQPGVGEGAFRMTCGPGPLLWDDPIVYPGQPGASPHLHQPFGNLALSGNSTYQSLRTTGNSTCDDPDNPNPVNRSGYWMPAMLDGAGHVVVPEYVTIYYKRDALSTPQCTPGDVHQIGACVDLPPGIRFITGYNAVTNSLGDATPFFYCQGSDIVDPSTHQIVGPTSVQTILKSNMNDVIPDCPVGARLTLNLGGPDCWDGKNLDVADHRSHVAHGGSTWDATTNAFYYKCDAAHPYHIPRMSIIAFYVVDANFEAGKWKLSCDDMMGTVPGGCFHTDYWEAWSPSVRVTWNKNCIDGMLSCASGDLGNGTNIRNRMYDGHGLVPVPPRP